MNDLVGDRLFAAIEAQQATIIEQPKALDEPVAATSGYGRAA